MVDTVQDEFDALGFPGEDLDATRYPYTADDDIPVFQFQNGTTGLQSAVEGKPKKTQYQKRNAASRISGGNPELKTVRKTLRNRIHQDCASVNYARGKDMILRYVKLFWDQDVENWGAMTKCITACNKDFEQLIQIIVQVALVETDDLQGTLLAWCKHRAAKARPAPGRVEEYVPLRG